jgi:hypothetical protein
MNTIFLFKTFYTFIVKVNGGHQLGKRQVLKHHTTYHVKQQPSGNLCGFFVCVNMLCFGSQPFTNMYFTVIVYFYICISYFTDTFSCYIVAGL